MRNAEMHNNGVIKTGTLANEFESLFGENAFQNEKHYAQLSFRSAVALIREFKHLASKYAEAVFMKPAVQQGVSQDA